MCRAIKARNNRWPDTTKIGTCLSLISIRYNELKLLIMLSYVRSNEPFFFSLCNTYNVKHSQWSVTEIKAVSFPFICWTQMLFLQFLFLITEGKRHTTKWTIHFHWLSFYAFYKTHLTTPHEWIMNEFQHFKSKEYILFLLYFDSYSVHHQIYLSWVALEIFALEPMKCLILFKKSLNF